MVRTTLYGALGFGVGLALAGAILGANSFNLSEFDTSVTVGAMLFALAGALGGALLGLAARMRIRLIPVSIASAVALGTGYFLLTSLYSIYLEPVVSGEMMVTAAFVVQFGLIGGFAGALMGAALRDRGQMVRLGLAGATGFGLGFLLQDYVSTWINEPVSGLAPGTLGDPTHDSMSLGFIFGTSFGIAGIVAGAVLGMVFSSADHKNAEPSG